MRCPFSLGMRQKTVREREREREKCIDDLGEMETLVGGGMGPLFHQRAFKETRTESGPQTMSEGGKAVGDAERESGVSRPSGSPTSGRRAVPSLSLRHPDPVSKPLGVLLAVLLHGKLCPWPMLPPHLTPGRAKGAPPSAPLEWVLKPQPDRKTRLLGKMVLTNFVGKENDNNCNKSQRKLVSPVSLARDLSHPKSGSTRPPRPPCPGAPEPS